MRSPSGFARRQDARAGADRDDEGVGVDLVEVGALLALARGDDEAVRPVEAAVARDDAHAGLDELRLHVLRLLAREQQQPLVDGAEVDGDLRTHRAAAVAAGEELHAQVGGLADGGRGLRGRDEGLRRDDVGEHGGAADTRCARRGSRRRRAARRSARPRSRRARLRGRRCVGCARTRRACLNCRASASDIARGPPTRVSGCRRTPPRRPERQIRSRSPRRRPTSCAEATGVETHDIALTLGSGWAKAADLIGETDGDRSRRPRSSASARPPSTGHVGTLRSVAAAERQARPRDRRPHPLLRGPRRAPGRALGAHGGRRRARPTMILTNGAGGIKEHWTPGTPVLISDHINLTAASPLEGATFIDLTDLYSQRLREHRPRRSSPTSTRASTCSSAARTTRPRPRCRWRRPSAGTSSGCRRRSRRSPRARPAWRSSASRSSRTSPPASRPTR